MFFPIYCVYLHDHGISVVSPESTYACNLNWVTLILELKVFSHITERYYQVNVHAIIPSSLTNLTTIFPIDIILLL